MVHVYVLLVPWYTCTRVLPWYVHVYVHTRVRTRVPHGIAIPGTYKYHIISKYQWYQMVFTRIPLRTHVHVYHMVAWYGHSIVPLVPWHVPMVHDTTNVYAQPGRVFYHRSVERAIPHGTRVPWYTCTYTCTNITLSRVRTRVLFLR